MIGLVDFVRVRHSKAVVLVEHYGPNINLLAVIFFGESFGKGYGKVIEGGNSMLR
jgi:hypothetical protein